MSEVLALKYRPKSFDEVIGQDNTVNQLKAAISSDTLGHALLFCGPRGTGKTTTARIIAKELNSKLSVAELMMCVVEIDAASNTGVDNVRELIENIRYSTQGHKVIILDEAHMLSKNAFNALLKTLEEPPPGVTFILVTTEPHKLLPTVRSRCQIYEFAEVNIQTLYSYYTEVKQKEEININQEQLQGIALKANGSVRDGLSILQKALSGETEEDNSKVYFELVGAIYNQDVTTALSIISNLRKAEEARVIVQTLEKWFYWASLEVFGQRTPIRQFFGENNNLEFDLVHLQRLFDICLDVERNFSATPNSKIVLEMGILKMSL